MYDIPFFSCVFLIYVVVVQPKTIGKIGKPPCIIAGVARIANHSSLTVHHCILKITSEFLMTH